MLRRSGTGDQEPRGNAAKNGDPGAAARSLVAILNPAAGAHPPADVRTVWHTEREAR